MAKTFPTLAEVKKIAKELHAIAKLSNPEAKLGHQYERIARLNGFNSWNHMAIVYRREK